MFRAGMITDHYMSTTCCTLLCSRHFAILAMTFTVNFHQLTYKHTWLQSMSVTINTLHSQICQQHEPKTSQE